MILPHNRLLWLVAGTIVPATLVAAVEPSMAAVAWTICAAVALVAGLDALLAATRAAGVRIDFPERLQVAKLREETLDFSIRDERGAVGSVLIGLALPNEITSPWEAYRAT